MAIMQITVIPLGTGSPSVGAHVAAVQAFLAQEGVPYLITDMGTVIQGGAGELLALAAKIHEIPFAHGVQRVVTQVALDDRRDKKVGLGDKVAAVRARLA